MFIHVTNDGFAVKNANMLKSENECYVNQNNYNALKEIHFYCYNKPNYDSHTVAIWKITLVKNTENK